MVIDIQRSQAADVDFVFALFRQRIGKLIVQAVDALDDKNILRSQGQIVAVVFTDALFEVELWDFHRLTLRSRVISALNCSTSMAPKLSKSY